MPAAASPAAPTNLVLDTNVVLDWLVFRNPVCSPLVEAIERGHVRWYSTLAIRDELHHVLARGSLARWQPDLQVIDEAHARWSTIVESAPASTANRWRCTDADDQKFIDLAVQLRDATLLSRDRAVLKLARRVRAVGVDILTPERWMLRLPSTLAPADGKPHATPGT